MAKRNRERAKQAKRKAKEERKAQRIAERLQRADDDLDAFGNPLGLENDREETVESRLDTSTEDGEDGPSSLSSP